MSFQSNPNFDRGETLTGTNSSGTFINDHLEGQEKTFPDYNSLTGTGAKSLRSGRPVRCRVFRNAIAAGVALLPKRVGVTAASAPYRVTGYANTTAQGRPVVVDEFLPASGVAYGDLFWGVMDGLAIIRYEIVPTNVLVAGDILVAATGAAASTGTTAATDTGDAGRIAKQVFAAPTDGATTTAFLAQLRNSIGTALTARTTANTNSDVLVDVKVNW